LLYRGGDADIKGMSTGADGLGYRLPMNNRNCPELVLKFKYESEVTSESE